MRKFVIFLVICYASIHSCHLFGQTTLWSGKLNVGPQSIEIRLHLQKESEVSTKVILDVPIQKAIGINASKVIMTSDSIIIDFGIIGANYKGRYISKDSIAGSWGQSGMQFPLSFKSVTSFEDKIVYRPQTPKAPFPYQVDQLVYKGKSTGLDYGVTFTYPSKEGRFPLVILITGSGQQDRDETIFDHKPFAVIADYLTKKGMAVMRVDDRGKGNSTGNFGESTSFDFSKDVEEHIAYAKTMSFVDPSKIGLLGHSEGGMIAPMVAARNKEVSFVILMAGPGIPITELMKLQNKKVLISEGVSNQAIDAYLTLYEHIMTIMSSIEDKTAANKKITNAVFDWYQATDKQTVMLTTGIKDSLSLKSYVNTIVGQFSSKWWQYFIAYHPTENLSKVQCPLLALNGSKDIQVAADEDLNGIEKAMISAKNKRYTIKKMDGLNHLFQKCNACTVQEYGELETTIDPEVLSVISHWLQEVQVL